MPRETAGKLGLGNTGSGRKRRAVFQTEICIVGIRSLALRAGAHGYSPSRRWAVEPCIYYNSSCLRAMEVLISGGSISCRYPGTTFCCDRVTICEEGLYEQYFQP